MIEDNLDLRKQIFKLQVQKNLVIQRNQSLMVLEASAKKQDNDDQTKLINQSEIMLPGENEKISDNNIDQKHFQRSKLKTISFRRMETKQIEENVDLTEYKIPSQKMIYPQQQSLSRSQTTQIIKKEIEEIKPKEEEEAIPQKKMTSGRAKILNLLSKGLLKQLTQQIAQPTEKVEIVKKIRGILSKDCKQRDDLDIDFLLECYKDKIDFFKIVSCRYGLTTLKQVFKAMKYETFDKGQKIFQIGEKGDKFYIILSGKVKVAVLKQQNSENEINQRSSFINSPKSPQRSSFVNSPKSPKRSSIVSPGSKTSPVVPSRQIGQIQDIFLKQQQQYNGNANCMKKVVKTSHQLFKMMDFPPNFSPHMKRLSKNIQDQKRASLQGSIDKSDIPTIEQQIEEFQEEIKTKYTIIRELCKGDSFGEMSMKPGKHSLRTATVYAEEKCEFAVISRYDYMHIITPLEQLDVKAKIEFLKNIPQFSSWEKKDLNMLSYCLHEQHIPKNSFLFKEGDPSNDLFFIQQGNFLDKMHFHTNKNIESIGNREFKITKECSTKISEVQDVEQSKQVKIKENLHICLCHINEIIGEESILGLSMRQFSVQAGSLDCSVFRVCKYDLENVYQNLVENKEDQYYNLLESLIQKKEWRLDRFNEMYIKFIKERKLMRSNTMNYVRLNSKSGQSTQRSRLSSNGASPNNLKLKATSNQYSAKINFNSAFQQFVGYSSVKEDQIDEQIPNSQNRSQSNSIQNQKSSRQQSMMSTIPINRSSSTSSEEGSDTSINQFTEKILANQGNTVTNVTSDLYNGEQLNSQQQLIQKQDISKPFDPDSYYEKLQQKLKQISDKRDSKSNISRINHNKMLNFEYTQQKQGQSTIDQDTVKSCTSKGLRSNFNQFTPLNNGQKTALLSQNNPTSFSQQINKLRHISSTPILHKAQSDKMRLNEEDERALQDYYKLKNLPISVVFSKADEQFQKKISSNNNQIQQRLKILGIETPQKKQYNKSQEDLSPKKNSAIFQKSESTGKLLQKQNSINNSPQQKNEGRLSLKFKPSIQLGKITQSKSQQMSRDSIDQSAFMQMIRERNGSTSTLQLNANPSSNVNYNKSSFQKQNIPDNGEAQRRTSYHSNEDRKKEDHFINEQKKQKQEYEIYLKEKQFIETMKSYANIYKVVEMNYLEQHSLKAHQLMKDTMDDMNLIHKFSQQTNSKKKQDNLFAVKRKEFTNKLMKKQKLQQFQKLKQQGLINQQEVNLNDSAELNNHLEKLADIQKQIFNDLNDPTGSKFNTYNFGGLKRRKIGVQLNQLINLKDEQQIQSQARARTNQSIEEESITPNSNKNNSSFQQEDQNRNSIANYNPNVVKDQTKNLYNNNIGNTQKLVQQKTMGVLAKMQKQHKKNLEQLSQKQLEINKLRNKFQQSAQLRLFKELKQQKDDNSKGYSIFEKVNNNNNNNVTRNQALENRIKNEAQKSMDAFVQRGYHRKSNTEYLSNILFGISNINKEGRNDSNSKAPQSQQFSQLNSQIFNSSQQNISTIQKPYQHINNIKQSEFSQFNSVWDNRKRQLQFKRILSYNN